MGKKTLISGALCMCFLTFAVDVKANNADCITNDTLGLESNKIKNIRQQKQTLKADSVKSDKNLKLNKSYIGVLKLLIPEIIK